MTQQEALEVLKMRRNVFLTGAAGSGKTYVLNSYIKFLKERGVTVGITASTGIAATHIHGLTIHSFAGIGIKRFLGDAEIKVIAGNKRVAARLRNAAVLVIDEISMLDAARLDLVDRVARFTRGSPAPFGGLQVILCGDFFQLPPVAEGNQAPPQFAYRAASWEALNLKICYLQEQHRQDDIEFLETLGAIRGASVGDRTTTTLASRCQAETPRHIVTKLYSHNVNVDAENNRKLAELHGEERVYQMETRGVPKIAETLKKGCLAPGTLALKMGAAVMFIKNNFERGYANGTLGTINGFRDGLPVVRTFGGKSILADPASWSVEEKGKKLAEIIQIPLRLAWAITIHKSQGMTLDAAQVDLRDAFEPGMGYVALSRVRGLASLYLLGFNDVALMVNTEVLEQDKIFQELSRQAQEELRAIPEEERQKFSASFRGVSVGGQNVNDSSDHSSAVSYAKIRASYPLVYAKWSAGEDADLVSAYSHGETISALAKKHHRKPGAIRSRIIKLGLIEQ